MELRFARQEDTFIAVLQNDMGKIERVIYEEDPLIFFAKMIPFVDHKTKIYDWSAISEAKIRLEFALKGKVYIITTGNLTTAACRYGDAVKGARVLNTLMPERDWQLPWRVRYWDFAPDTLWKDKPILQAVLWELLAKRAVEILKTSSLVEKQAIW